MTALLELLTAILEYLYLLSQKYTVFINFNDYMCSRQSDKQVGDRKQNAGLSRGLKVVHRVGGRGCIEH